MSLSVYGKIRNITLSNLHTLLDSIDALNTVGKFEQYLRDLRSARDELDDQSAASRGRKAYLLQQIATNTARSEVADRNIDLLLGDDDPSNDHLATPLQIQLDAANAQIEAANRELDIVSALVTKYDVAVQRIDVRLMEAEAKLEAMRSAEQCAKASERAAKALEGIDFGASPDTSAAESRLAQRAAVADNALNRSLNRMTGAIGGVTSQEAAAQAALIERRAKIAAAKKAADTGNPGSNA